MLLLSGHAMLAGICKAPELALDATEAKQLANAAANVARHYNLQTTQKAMDWTNLLMCVGMIYGTRIIAVRMKRKAEKAEPELPLQPAPNGNGFMHVMPRAN